jgi:hypothetical protein
VEFAKSTDGMVGSQIASICRNASMKAIAEVIHSQKKRTPLQFKITARHFEEAIQEFTLQTSNFAAEFGIVAGGLFNFTSKGGTNQFHGSLREFHRDRLTAANSFFNNKSGIPRAQLIRNQFGGSIGGPVIKDKLFFFGGIQRTWVRTIPHGE